MDGDISNQFAALGQAAIIRYVSCIPYYLMSWSLCSKWASNMMRLALAQVLAGWCILAEEGGLPVICTPYSVRHSIPRPSEATITEGYADDPYSMTR